MVRRRAKRAVSNHGSKFGLAAILRDALASLGLLRMRSEWWKDSQPLSLAEPSTPSSPAMCRFLSSRRRAIFDFNGFIGMINAYTKTMGTVLIHANVPQ